MVDVIEASAIVAAAGVLVGVVYYALDLRYQTKMRKTDLFLRLFAIMQSKDWQEAWEKISNLETDDLTKMMKEHRVAEINQVMGLLEQTGMLLQMKLVDIDMVERMLGGTVISTWDTMKPAFEGSRKLRRNPRIAEGFEYLYNEMKKREQQLASKTA